MGLFLTIQRPSEVDGNGCGRVTLLLGKMELDEATRYERMRAEDADQRDRALDEHVTNILLAP